MVKKAKRKARVRHYRRTVCRGEVVDYEAVCKCLPSCEISLSDFMATLEDKKPIDYGKVSLKLTSYGMFDAYVFAQDRHGSSLWKMFVLCSDKKE